MIKKIISLANVVGKKLTDKQLNSIIHYASLLNEWNPRINLVSRKDTKNIFENHIAPSMVYYLLDLFTSEDKKIVDLGSGGGFPGIINAILHDHLIFTLIDSTQKKTKFLKLVIDELNLINCTCEWGRIEEISKSKLHNRSYDVCTSRGLSALNKLIPYGLPYINKSGIILALKGGDLKEEINNIKKRSRYKITEYEMDEIFHYIDRFKTLKIVEVERNV